jgi:preprotein translocase subunit SecG
MMGLLPGILMVLLLLTALFLIVLVLVQRGKGGGLAGAFGGLGGQSAFGTKAGDLFTRITIGVATFWIILCMIAVKILGGASEGPLSKNLGGAGQPQGTVSAKQEPGGPAEPVPAAPAPKQPGKNP